MKSVDRRSQELKENYGHMTEDELCAVAKQAYDLTDIAREALQAVITEQGFDIPLRLEPPASPQAEQLEDDEGLINFGWPADLEQAWWMMAVLSAAGIPSFLGPDNVMHLEEFWGEFGGSVSLKIRDVDRRRAYAALAKANRNDDHDKEEPEEEKDYAVLCPKCRSAEVVLEGRDSKLREPPPKAKFFWRCDACGHSWTDQGISQEVEGSSFSIEESKLHDDRT